MDNMDEIDFTISLMLIANSRMPYRELAEMLKMSVNSVHKRVKSLVEIGVIQNFQTKLGYLFFPNTINVTMFGETPTKNRKTLMDKLGNHECIYNVSQASGNLFYIHAYIRNLNELDSLVSFVRKTGEIKELSVGLGKGSTSSDINNSNDITISKLDYLLINSLKDNSRKTISDVADEIGASTKTVRRHLDTLIEKYLVRFTIDWYPDKTPEIMSMITLKLKPNIDFDDVIFMDSLRKRYGIKIVFHWAFSNLPNLLVICTWTKNMKEIQEIESFLMSMEFESVDVNVLVEGKMYLTWVDTYLDNKIKEFTNS
jgi:DNA-binding Lrp family transcriptional regulator